MKLASAGGSTEGDIVKRRLMSHSNVPKAVGDDVCGADTRGTDANSSVYSQECVGGTGIGVEGRLRLMWRHKQ